MSDKYKKYMKIVSETQHRFGIDKVKTKAIDNFNVNTMEDILRIKKTEHEISDLDYRKIYEKNKSDVVYLCLLLQCQHCPSQIIDDIINNENMIWQPEQVRDLLNRDNLTNEQLEWVCTNMQAKIESAVGRTYGYKGEYYIERNLSNEKTIQLIEKLKSQGVEGMSARLIKYITDEEYLKKTIEDEFSDNAHKETAMSEIISNSDIPDNIRDMAFDAGADIEFIHKYTPYIANEIYGRATETIFEINDENYKKTEEYRRAEQVAYAALYNMGIRGALTDAQQYDYVNRLKLLNPRAQDRALSTFLPQTTSISTLLVAKELKNKDAMIAYENPHMPKEEIAKKAHKYCSKMHKNGTLKAFPEVWIDYLCSFVKKATLNTKDYVPLIAYINSPQRPSSATEMALNLCISPYTPEEVIGEAVETLYELKKKPIRENVMKKIDTIISLSKINIAYRKEGFSDNALMPLLTLIYNCGNVMSTSTSISPYERNLFSDFKARTGESLSSFMALLEETKKSFEGTDCTSKVNRLLYINESLEKEAMMYSNDGIETMSHYDVCIEQDFVMKQIRNSRDAIELYENIYNYADRYNDLCERKVDLEKQEKECRKTEEKGI